MVIYSAEGKQRSPKLKTQQKVLPTNTARLLAPALTSPARITRLQNGLKVTLIINQDGNLVAVKH